MIPDTKFLFILIYSSIGIYIVFFLSQNNTLLLNYLKNIGTTKYLYFFFNQIKKIFNLIHRYKPVEFLLLKIDRKKNELDKKLIKEDQVFSKIKFLDIYMKKIFSSKKFLLFFLLTLFFMFGSVNGYTKIFERLLPYKFIFFLLIIAIFSIYLFREINSAIAFYCSFLIGAFIPFWLFKGNHIIGLGTLVVNDAKN